MQLSPYIHMMGIKCKTLSGSTKQYFKDTSIGTGIVISLNDAQPVFPTSSPVFQSNNWLNFKADVICQLLVGLQ